jgi:hypothetical protein
LGHPPVGFLPGAECGALPAIPLGASGRARASARSERHRSAGSRSLLTEGPPGAHHQGRLRARRAQRLRRSRLRAFPSHPPPRAGELRPIRSRRRESFLADPAEGRAKASFAQRVRRRLRSHDRRRRGRVRVRSRTGGAGLGSCSSGRSDRTSPARQVAASYVQGRTRRSGLRQNDPRGRTASRSFRIEALPLSSRRDRICSTRSRRPNYEAAGA